MILFENKIKIVFALNGEMLIYLTKSKYLSHITSELSDLLIYSHSV